MPNKLYHSIFICLLIILVNIKLSGQKYNLVLGSGVSKFNFDIYEQVNLDYPNGFKKNTFMFSGIGGLDIRFKLFDEINFNVGIFYARKGNRIHSKNSNQYPWHSDSIYNFNNKHHLILHYLDIPLAIHFEKIYSYIGVQPSYLIGGVFRNNYYSFTSFHEEIYSEKSSKETQDINFKNKGNNIRRFDFGFILGFEYPLNDMFGIGFRYYHGVKSVYKSIIDNQFNTQITFTVAYKLKENIPAKKEKEFFY